MPSQYKLKLGNLLYQTFQENLVPAEIFQSNPTFNNLWRLGRNVIIYIVDPHYGSLGHPDYFTYNNHNKTVHADHFVFRTNSRDLLTNRENLFRDYRRRYNQTMTYDSIVVTYYCANLVGAILHKYQIITFISILFGIRGWIYARRYNTSDRYTKAKIVMFSLLLAQISVFLTTYLLEFEGKFTNLLNMTETANTKGMTVLTFPFNLIYPHEDLHNQGINAALKYWSTRPDLYKLNMVTVDDFHSSNIVEVAIDSIWTYWRAGAKGTVREQQ